MIDLGYRTGRLGVGGSNPLAPTNQLIEALRFPLFDCHVILTGGLRPACCSTKTFGRNCVGVSDTGQTDLCGSAYRFPRVLGDA
jgi:hypothetical protein